MMNYITFEMLRNQLKIYRSPSYLKWLKERHPGKDVHHILGSAGTAIKTTDYLCTCIDRIEHMAAEKDKKAYFYEYFIPALNEFFQYVNELERTDEI